MEIRMRTHNKVLREMARESLKGKWILAIGTFLIWHIISSFHQIMTPRMFEIDSTIPTIIAILTGGALNLGLTFFSLSISRNEEAQFKQIFAGFNHFVSATITYCLMWLLIFLWSLLLLIPGLIACLSYSMTFFILADDPSVKPLEAIQKSKEMMTGYKSKLLTLYLFFIGLFLLGILTFGIAWLWIYPYYQISLAKFYDDVKSNSVIVETN